MNKYINHYTSIQNLALILSSRKIRFNRLDKVDDLNEIDGLPRRFGTYVYISCWTDDIEESLPLWKMYTQNMRGVRITLPKDMFKKNLLKYATTEAGLTKDMYSPLSSEEMITNNYFISNFFENESSFFKHIVYEDNYPQIHKKNYNETGKSLEISNLYMYGAYKKKIWEFEKECRFTLYALPLLPLEHPLINGKTEKQMELITYGMLNDIENVANYIDVDLEESIIDNISLRLGPMCDDADLIIVDTLLKRYAKNGLYEMSHLDGTIRR
jgi:hypothetical protein